jgi:hypothetical protein
MTNKNIIILKGLPNSGKTYYANRFIQDHPEYVSVSKHEIRKGLKNYFADEKLVEDIYLHTIQVILDAGNSVLLDDYNLDNVEERLKSFDATIITQSFLDVPVMECIQRDPTKTDVIIGLYKEYLLNKKEQENVEFLPVAYMDSEKNTIFIVSGGMSKIKHEKQSNDQRPDWLWKEQLFETEIRGKFYVDKVNEYGDVETAVM